MAQTSRRFPNASSNWAGSSSVRFFKRKAFGLCLRSARYYWPREADFRNNYQRPARAAFAQAWAEGKAQKLLTAATIGSNVEEHRGANHTPAMLLARKAESATLDAADPLNLLQVMLAEGCCFASSAPR